jgi:hypothetical protein
LAKVGFAALAMSTPEMAEGGDADMEDIMKRITPKQASDMASLQEATVAAGCYGVGDADGNWDDLTLVIDAKRADADKGILWVGSLPPGVTDALFGSIMNLSTNKDEAAAALASFRSKPGASTNRRRTGKAVRKTSA